MRGGPLGPLREQQKDSLEYCYLHLQGHGGRCRASHCLVLLCPAVPTFRMLLLQDHCPGPGVGPGQGSHPADIFHLTGTYSRDDLTIEASICPQASCPRLPVPEEPASPNLLTADDLGPSLVSYQWHFQPQRNRLSASGLRTAALQPQPQYPPLLTGPVLCKE